jgi:hypothetical protein
MGHRTFNVVANSWKCSGQCIESMLQSYESVKMKVSFSSRSIGCHSPLYTKVLSFLAVRQTVTVCNMQVQQARQDPFTSAIGFTQP